MAHVHFSFLLFLFRRRNGKYVNVNGKSCINLATFNFLSMIGKKEIEVFGLFFRHLRGFLCQVVKLCILIRSWDQDD